jgi:cytochrome c oxidase subunit II
MGSTFPLFPASASTVSGRVDALFGFLTGVSAVITLVIFALIILFSVKYRRRSPDEVGTPTTSVALETAWTVIPFVIMLVMFAWGANLYFTLYRVPTGPDALEIQVVGKQWMWKFQHLGGQREINELHVPVGRPVKLVMASQDVIHSFFVPAFRVKADVIPGTYRTIWFEATQPGTYHLFCAEYCGLQHSGMVGWVTAMEPRDYQAWLQGGGAVGGATTSPAAEGHKLFLDLGCHTCHNLNQQGIGPMLTRLFGGRVQLQNGQTVIADEDYIRESIVDPLAKIAAGFQPVMPSFKDRVDEEQLMQLITYIRSLGTQQTQAVTVLPPQGGPGTSDLSEAWQGAAAAMPIPPQRTETQP